jgi:hypothetical protein
MAQVRREPAAPLRWRASKPQGRDVMARGARPTRHAATVGVARDRERALREKEKRKKIGFVKGAWRVASEEKRFVFLRAGWLGRGKNNGERAGDPAMVPDDLARGRGCRVNFPGDLALAAGWPGAGVCFFL